MEQLFQQQGNQLFDPKIQQFSNNSNNNNNLLDLNGSQQQKQDSDELKAMKKQREFIQQQASRTQRSLMIEQIRRSIMKQNDDEYNEIQICTNPQIYQNQVQGMQQAILECKNYKFKKEEHDQIEENIVKQEDITNVMKSLIGLRKLLQQDIIDRNNCDLDMMPNLVKYLQMEQFPRLQAEASNIICSLCAGENYNQDAFINIGGMEKMMYTYKNTQEKYFKINTIWTIGNLAQDSKNRDFIIQSKIISKITQEIYSENDDYIESVGWLFYNICSKKPYPKYKDVKDIINYSVQILKVANLDKNREQIVQNLKTLKLVSQFELTNLRDQEHLIQSKILDVFYAYLNNSEAQPFYSIILNTLGNLICDLEGEFFNEIVNKFIDTFTKCMFCDQNNIKINALFCLINLSGGDELKMNVYFQNKQYIPLIKLIDSYVSQTSSKVQRQIMQFLVNILTHINLEELQFLLEKSLLNVLDLGLDSIDNETVLKSCSCFLIILTKCFGSQKVRNPNPSHPVRRFMEDRGIVEKFEGLLQDEDDEVYDLAEEILEKYFPDEDENDYDENMEYES